MADNIERREAHDYADAVEAGLLGVEVDPTPNEHYTVAGVLAGKPVPETDADAAKAAGVEFGRAAAGPSGTATSSKRSRRRKADDDTTGGE